MEQTEQSVLKDNPVIAQAIVKSPTQQLVQDVSKEKTLSKDQLNTLDVIKAKISWATEQLKNSTVLSYDIELLEYIKKSSEAIAALKKADI